MVDMNGDVRVQSASPEDRDDFGAVPIRPDRLFDQIAQGLERLPGRSQVDDFESFHDDRLEEMFVLGSQSRGPNGRRARLFIFRAPVLTTTRPWSD